MKKLITTGAAAAIALTSLGLAPAMAETLEPVNTGKTCEVGGDSSYMFKVETEKSTNPADLWFDEDGDPTTKDDQKVVGTATWDDPSDGYVTIALGDDYEVMLCVKGGSTSGDNTNAIKESGWLADGAAFGPVENKNGPAAVSHFTYVVKQLPLDECELEEVVTGQETAWAAGNRYVTKGNWATYTSHGALTSGVPLKAGQEQIAGTVTANATAKGMTITVELNDGWKFADNAEAVKVQSYTGEAPKGNPSPGLFDFKNAEFDGRTATITVDAGAYYGVHVDVLSVAMSEICPA